MSEPDLSIPAAEPAAPPTPLQLVRLPVDKAHLAVAFLGARARGVMDLIAHFWEGLAQTPPLQRPDLHLVLAVNITKDEHISITQIEPDALAGAMLYVPKAHRADILALHPAAAAALAAYICHQGCKIIRAETPFPVHAETDTYHDAESIVERGESIATIMFTDLSGRQPVVESIPTELCASSIVTEGWQGGVKGASGTGQEGGKTTANGGDKVGLPIDFITGAATGIAWITPLLLPLVHKRTPARQLTNVVMQLPADVTCGLDPHVRPARESDIPLLNRWRRLYKEERGIHFDADMDALVQNQRVFVYELPDHDTIDTQGNQVVGNGPSTTGVVVAVAKFDLDLKEQTEIGGVYTFPEYRQRGYSVALMSDLAHRIRQAGKVPTLQVDETNIPAMRLYERTGWRALGRLARVWLTG